MNNQNPLIPQGSALEQKNKGRARVKIAVFFVLAIHGIGLMALLMQGCGQSKEPVDTNGDHRQQPASGVCRDDQPAGHDQHSARCGHRSSRRSRRPRRRSCPAGATEYTIVKGDILEQIAKKFHVSVKAITDANPGIEPTKLKIGQKIHIPAPPPRRRRR